MSDQSVPVFDLHADLLSFLADKADRSVDDPASRCSLPLLRAGGVKIQALPVFTKTGSNSLQYGERQLQLLAEKVCGHASVRQIRRVGDIDPVLEEPDIIGVIPAFENASGFCGEDEPLSSGLNRLKRVQDECGPLLYISLTWNGENRFGGGAGSAAGLKPDGLRLLEVMAADRVAVDLSHASDALAGDILELIEQRKLRLSVLASHSNFRSIQDVPRNLPNDLARRIIALGGVIGLNSIEEFLGGVEFSHFQRHLDHGLRLGGSHSLAIGSDFFCDSDIPPGDAPPEDRPMFAPWWPDAGATRTLTRLMAPALATDLPAVCYANARRLLSALPD
jgi:membrane dipeptidase